MLRLGHAREGSEVNQSLELEINRLHAEICAGLADPKRILILYELSAGPRNVSELTANLRLDQSSTSRHLKVLRERGLVTAARAGPAVEYRLSDDRLIQALDLLRAVLQDSLNRRAELAEALSESRP